ncbi:TonB-dependent receptor [bacterium]|nr:TonB-dependent receptor [bacterium]
MRTGSLLGAKFTVAALLLGISLSAGAEENESALSELPPVTVSANPLNPTLLEYGKPISVMGREEIESRMESTLGETIRLEPGVRSSFFGQGASRPVIRGFAGDRVRVLKNGVTTGDVSDVSEDHVVVADPMQAEQIEILRGPETLLYGSGAIGGAVNVTDDSIPEAPLGKPFEGNVLGQLGNSADNERTLGAKLRGESGNLNWHVSGFARETDDYEIPGFAESSRFQEMEAIEHDHEEEHEDDHKEDHGDEHEEEGETRGKLDNSDTESWGATVGGSYVWEKGFVGVSVGGFGSDYGVPGHVHAEEHEGEDEHEEEEHEHGEEDVRIEAEQVRVDMRGRVDDLSESIESVKFRVGYADYEHDEIEGGAIGTTYERDTVETRLEFLHSPFAGLSGAFGFQVLYDDFSALGEEAFLVPVKTWSPAFFVFEEATLTDSLNFRVGGRVEAVSHDPEGLESQDFVPFSVSAGPVWNPTGDGEYSIGLNFAYTERAPNAIELFSNGQHLARQIFEVGDSELDKESSWGVDLAVRKDRGVVTGGFTPFYQGFSNYINLSGTGGEDEGLPIFAYEEIDAYFWGFEFESAFHVDQIVDMGPHGFALEYQADYVRARNEDASADVPRIPPLRNIIRARYNYSNLWEALVEGVFVEEQDDVAEFEIPTDSYALLNTEVNVRLPFLENRDLRLFARGTNLTDDEARVHSSFLKDLAPLRGRSFLFGIRANI